MFVDITVLLVFVFVSSVDGQVSDEWRPPRLAKLYQSGEPTYISTPGDGVNYAWYTVEDRRQFIFQVKACSGALLAFATYTDGVESYVVDIGLGIHGNLRSVIRQAGNPLTEFLTATPYILHCNELRSFWVKWDWDYFVVGHGPIVDEQVFMNWKYPDGQAIFNAVGLSSTNGTSAIWRIHENSGDRLIVETPDEHRYKTMWKSVMEKKFWTFGVRAGGDVHVLLSEKLEVTSENIYEFVIGGWMNNRTVIRTQVLGGADSIKAQIDLKNIVSNAERRQFWISWWNGTVELGRGSFYGQLRLLQWRDQRPITVRFLAVTTGFGNVGRWYMQDDQESFSYIFTSPTTSTLPEIKYKMAWVASPREEFFVFSVMSCADVSVLLSDILNVDAEYAIEIVIGAQNNTIALFRYLSDEGSLAQVYSTFLLDCDQLRSFWISWHNGTVRLGSGYVYPAGLILEKQVFDANPTEGGFRVGALALATPISAGVWRIRETVGESIHLRLQEDFNHFRYIWRSVAQRNYFLFSVRACSDCHVGLSPTMGVDPDETYLDLVISGWNNQISQIRKIVGDTDREDFSAPVSTPQLLDCNRHINLWVSWNDMKIRFGRGSIPGFHEILVHPLTSAFPVKAVSVSSGFGYDGDFIMEEDTGDYLMFYTYFNEKLKWMELASYVTWFSLKIRACDAVFMYLCPTVRNSDDNLQDCYNLSLATENNTKSVLSKGVDKLAEVDTPGLFNCWDNRHIWIRWSQTKLEIGHGTIPGQNKFISCDSCHDVTIASVGFNSLRDDYYARWQIQRNMLVSMSFYTPVDFSYLQVWESIEHRRGISFGVTACSDVNVVLSHTIRNFTTAYDVVIGGDRNTHSMIRIEQKIDYVKVETPDILSCGERRFFWLTWQNGAIEVGHGEIIGKMKFIDFQPLQLYSVKAVGFSTGSGSDGNWYFKQGLMPTEAPVTEKPDTETTEMVMETPNDLSADEIIGIALGVTGGILLAILIALYILRPKSASEDTQGIIQ